MRETSNRLAGTDVKVSPAATPPRRAGPHRAVPTNRVKSHGIATEQRNQAPKTIDWKGDFV